MMTAFPLYAIASRINFFLSSKRPAPAPADARAPTPEGDAAAQPPAPASTPVSAAAPYASAGLAAILTDLGGRLARLIGSGAGDARNAPPLETDGLSDFYFLADLGGLAASTPGGLHDAAVRNGNGTYALRYNLNGQAVYVAADALLPLMIDKSTEISAAPGPTMAEKAYAEQMAKLAAGPTPPGPEADAAEPGTAATQG